MAVSYEKGIQGKPVEVSHSLLPQAKNKSKQPEKPSLSTGRDYESIAVMNQRRQLERQKLIDEMKMEDLL